MELPGRALGWRFPWLVLTGGGKASASEISPRCYRPSAARKTRPQSGFRRLWPGAKLVACFPMPLAMLARKSRLTSVKRAPCGGRTAARPPLHRLAGKADSLPDTNGSRRGAFPARRFRALTGASGPAPAPIIKFLLWHSRFHFCFLGADTSAFHRLRPGRVLGLAPPMLWAARGAAAVYAECHSPAPGTFCFPALTSEKYWE